MGTFTGSALNGFVQGQRLYDQDARIEEKHDWARDENVRAGDRHNWAGQTHQALQTRRGLENRALERAENDDREYRGALNISPGKMQAQKENDARADAQKERERQQDMALMARGFFQFESSGDPNFLTGAMGQTFLGKGKSYTPQWDKEKKTFSIINRDGKVILRAQGQTHEDMMDKLQDMLITGLSDPANYLKARKAQRSAINLEILKHKNAMDKVGKENEGKIAVEKQKGANQRALKGMDSSDKDTLVLPWGEKVPREQADKEIPELLKFIKEGSNNKGLAEMFTMARGGQINPDDLFKDEKGQRLIQYVEEVAADESNPRAQRYANRVLALIDAKYGAPEADGYGKRSDGNFQQSGEKSNYGPVKKRFKYNLQTGEFE